MSFRGHSNTMHTTMVLMYHSLRNPITYTTQPFSKRRRLLVVLRLPKWLIFFSACGLVVISFFFYLGKNQSLNVYLSHLSYNMPDKKRIQSTVAEVSFWIIVAINSVFTNRCLFFCLRILLEKRIKKNLQGICRRPLLTHLTLQMVVIIMAHRFVVTLHIYITCITYFIIVSIFFLNKPFKRVNPV